MNLQELVETAFLEAKLPGSPPTTVVGQTGRSADVVRWVIAAYNDIQRHKRWKWMRARFTLDTVADTSEYAYGDCTDVAAAAAITRFREWDLAGDDRPHIYLVSDGEATESKIALADWEAFRAQYVLGSHDSAFPNHISADWLDVLHLGPTPNGIYRISGSYWKSNQTLADDDDIPEMPEDYHQLIVWRALTKYGYAIVAQEILALAQSEGTALYEALCDNQAHSKFKLRLGEALA